MYEYYKKLYSEFEDITISAINVGGYNVRRKDNQSKTLREAFDKNIICEFEDKENPENKFSVIKTVFPHGMYESLLFVLDESKPGIDMLSNNILKQMILSGYYFIKFVSRKDIIQKYELENGVFHFVYNYDPYTIDRESGMSEKSFHLHLNYWTSKEMPLSDISFNKLDLNTKVRTVDPITFLAESILYDLLNNQLMSGSVMDMDIERDKKEKLPFGFKVMYNSWKILESDCMIQDLLNMHQIMVRFYEKLEKCFFKKNNKGIWTRGTLRNKEHIIENIDELNELSIRSKDYLKVFAATIKNISPRAMEYLKKNKSARLLNLSMAGLNYSLGIYSPKTNTVETPLISHNQIYLTIQVKMFSGTGGAGIPKMGSRPIVILNRNHFQYNNEEKIQREHFQLEFADELKEYLKWRTSNEEGRIYS